MSKTQGADSGVAPRRIGKPHVNQGLKPLATLALSLRDLRTMDENGHTQGNPFGIRGAGPCPGRFMAAHKQPRRAARFFACPPSPEASSRQAA